MTVINKVFNYIQENNSNGEFELKQRDFSEIIGENQSSINTSLRRLCKDGIIEKIKRGNSYTPSIYKIKYSPVIKDNTINIVNYQPSTDIRQLAEVAVQAIITIMEMAIESQNQKEELSQINSNIYSSMAKMMEVFSDGETQKAQ